MRKQFWVKCCKFSKIAVTDINPINQFLQREISLAKRENRKRGIFNADSNSGVRRWAAFTMISYPTQHDVTKSHAEKWHQKYSPVFLTLSLTLQKHIAQIQFCFWPQNTHAHLSLSAQLAGKWLRNQTFFAKKSYRFCTGNPQILGIMDNKIKQVVCLTTTWGL